MGSPEKELGGLHSHASGDLKGRDGVSIFENPLYREPPPVPFASPGSASGSYFEPHLSAALHKVVMKPGLMPTSDLELARVIGVAGLEKLELL